MNIKTKKHDMPYVHVRMPEDLKETLTIEAKANARTLTSEIIYRLERSLKFDARNAIEPRLTMPYHDLIEALEFLKKSEQENQA
jgi:hypothetical protein